MESLAVVAGGPADRRGRSDSGRGVRGRRARGAGNRLCLGDAHALALSGDGWLGGAGAIAGPGTETSDEVPAMLSDGEFVMTARAVRGAGDGNRQRGVRRMYDMMRMFEGGVAR